MFAAGEHAKSSSLLESTKRRPSILRKSAEAEATVSDAIEKLMRWDRTPEKQKNANEPSLLVKAARAKPLPEPLSTFGGEARVSAAVEQLLMWDSALMTSKFRSLEADVDKRFLEMTHRLRGDISGEVTRSLLTKATTDLLTFFWGTSPEDKQERAALTQRVQNLELGCTAAIDHRIERALKKQERLLSKRLETMENGLKISIDKVATISNIVTSTSGTAADTQPEFNQRMDGLEERMRQFDERVRQLTPSRSGAAAATLPEFNERMAALDERVCQLDEFVRQLDGRMEKAKEGSRSDLLGVAAAFGEQLAELRRYADAELLKVAGMQTASTPKWASPSPLQAAATQMRRIQHDTDPSSHSSSGTPTSSTIVTTAATVSVVPPVAAQAAPEETRRARSSRFSLPYTETTSCFSSSGSGANSPTAHSSTVQPDIVRCEDSYELPNSGIGFLAGDQKPRPRPPPLEDLSPGVDAEPTTQCEQALQGDLERRDRFCDVFPRKQEPSVVRPPPLAMGLVAARAKLVVDKLHSARKESADGPVDGFHTFRSQVPSGRRNSSEVGRPLVVNSARLNSARKVFECRIDTARSNMGIVAQHCKLFEDKIDSARSQADQSRNLKLNSARKVLQFIYGTPSNSDQGDREGLCDRYALQALWHEVESLRGDVERLGQETASDRQDWHRAFESIRDLIAHAMEDAGVTCESMLYNELHAESNCPGLEALDHGSGEMHACRQPSSGREEEAAESKVPDVFNDLFRARLRSVLTETPLEAQIEDTIATRVD